MDLVIQKNKQSEISFSVNIAGTNQLPKSVLFVLDDSNRILSFRANQVNDKWVVNVNPELFNEGTVNYRIEILVNNQLYVPFKGIATIKNDEPTVDVSFDLPKVEEIPEAKKINPHPKAEPKVQDEPGTKNDFKITNPENAPEFADKIADKVSTPNHVPTPKHKPKAEPVKLLKTFESQNFNALKKKAEEQAKDSSVTKPVEVFSIKKIKIVTL